MIKICQSFTTLFLMCYHCITLVEANEHYKSLTVLVGSNECSGIHRKEIIFEEGTAINFTLNYLNEYYYNQRKYIVCNYRLEPRNRHRGIFATIQELSLHTRGNECSSYVEFATALRRKSKKFCGKLSAADLMNLNQQTFDTQSNNNTFINTNGAIDINIFITKEAINQNMTINVIFTLFDYCIASEYSKPCLETREFCIHENFINDGIINCPFYGCVDEGGCVKDQFRQSVGGIFLIYAVALIVFFAIIIITLTVYCVNRNFKQIRNRNNLTEAQVTRAIELDDIPNEFQNMNVHCGTLNDSEDKDLPPSYESLFPSR